MQLQDLKFKKLKTKKRVGRGGSRGKTSGKGTKGQTSRAGNSTRAAERDFIKKIPKLRGYKFNSVREKTFSLNISDLVKSFKDGEEISQKTLHEKGFAIKKGGRYSPVKILGSGEISFKVFVSGCCLSKSAKEKIEKAGGSIVEKKKISEK
jgi:large subunit ribosomal protein L15